MRRSGKVSVLCILVAGVVLRAQSALGCAACFGKSDSNLAQGMNWGIFSLLLVVLCVLGGIGSFFVYLARKSAAIVDKSSAQPLSPLTEKI